LELAASNHELVLETTRRTEAEQALTKSEHECEQLMVRSDGQLEQLRRLSRKVLSAQEDELKRISRKLRDVIAQTLNSINVRLSNLKTVAAMNSRGLDRNITRTQQMVDKTVNIVHRFARELRPTVLDDLGLIPALQILMKNFVAQSGVHARLIVFAGEEQLETVQLTVLYRVVQEALANVALHARASQVEVCIQKVSHGISLRITDDGRSFSPERVLRAAGGKHIGLLEMRERVDMASGQFNIQSAPGIGTTVQVVIPVGMARKGHR
jgi:signal transduction histidine kinase